MICTPFVAAAVGLIFNPEAVRVDNTRIDGKGAEGQYGEWQSPLAEVELGCEKYGIALYLKHTSSISTRGDEGLNGVYLRYTFKPTEVLP